MGVALRVGLGVAVALALLAPAASADVIAVVEHRAPGRADTDIVRVNAGTGAMTPASFNTAEDEFHPSVSSDGNRIAFERYDPRTGDHLLVNDLRTGQTADVIDGDLDSPAISPDGQTLLAGGPLQQFADSIDFSDVTLSSLSTFPSGPYARSSYQPQYSFSSGGLVTDPEESGSLIAFDVFGSEIILAQLGGSAAAPLASATFFYSHPAIASPGGVPTVVFDERTQEGRFEIASRPASPVASFPGPPTPLSSAALDTSDGFDPAFTADGRYIGFLRLVTNFDARLFVWDTQTQTLINSAGVDIGDPSLFTSHTGLSVTPDNLGLFERTVLVKGTVVPTGTVTFALAGDSGVGILVQRVVGHHRLFGRRVPTLKPVGRVPLGRFKKGRRHVHWNLKVNGHRLKRGTYQVTVRSVTASGKVRDFGAPKLIRLR